MSALLSAGVAGAAALGSAAIGAVSTGKMNKRSVAFARESFVKQDAQNQMYWRMQNAYNDPSAQMARLKNAGLNPNLVYGNGATTESANLQSTTPQATPRQEAIQLDLSSVAQMALHQRQVQANIARTEAETRAIDSRTAGSEFQNQLNQSIGIQKMVDNYSWASEKVATESQKANADWLAYQSGAFDGKSYDDPNSPVAKAIKAGYKLTEENLKNAKALGDIRRYETTIKQFEANLVKSGISPNSPWYVKIVGDLLKNTLNMDNLKESINLSN